MIGAFPWDPFPPGEPDPKGPDPIHALAFRAAVTAADAYHAVRLALRREGGTLRVGNRFVPDGRAAAPRLTPGPVRYPLDGPPRSAGP